MPAAPPAPAEEPGCEVLGLLPVLLTGGLRQGLTLGRLPMSWSFVMS